MVRKEQELTLKQSLRTGSWRVPFFFSLKKHLADPSGVPVQYIPGHKSACCDKQEISLKRKVSVIIQISPRFLQHHVSGENNWVWWLICSFPHPPWMRTYMCFCSWQKNSCGIRLNKGSIPQYKIVQVLQAYVGFFYNLFFSFAKIQSVSRFYSIISKYSLGHTSNKFPVLLCSMFLD